MTTKPAPLCASNRPDKASNLLSLLPHPNQPRALLATLVLASSLSLAVAAPASGDSAVVANIRDLSSTEVEALKHAAGVNWWLELGERMLLAGDAGKLKSLLPASRLGDLISDVSPQQFALRGRGCSEHTDEPGTLITRGGRTELRRLASNERMPAHEEWAAVEPNRVIVQSWRKDAHPRLAADPLIVPIVNHIDADRWFGDVDMLAAWDRSSYSTQLVDARNWIGDRFEDIGLLRSDPGFTLPGSGGLTVHNIVGTWTGTRYPDEWIVVGGHYDSINQYGTTTNTPGAEDNATGCAGVIELARALVAFRPQRTVVFMCYAGEEQGLHGSQAHVDALQKSGNLGKVKAVVTMDMIGYSADASLDVLLETRSAHTSYINRFANAAATYVPELTTDISFNPFGSDHMPYLGKNLPAMLAIELDYDIYPHYHESTDLPQNLGPHARAMGSAILRMNVAVLADLAGASDRIFDYDAEAAP